jgi:toxin ParE1/3/4
LRVRWTERASKDAFGIFDFIAAQSPAYAESVCERILARPSQLEGFPESRSIVPEYDRPDIRELFVSSFRLIYGVESDEVRVLTVIHGSRQSLPRPEELG